MKNQNVIDATSSKFDKRAMTINDIIETDVKFSSMVVKYKVYHSNQENSVFNIAIYVAYQMVKENKDHDMCEVLWSHLMENITSIKKDKKNTFKYGTLILCLFFYFINEILGWSRAPLGFGVCLFFVCW